MPGAMRVCRLCSPSKMEGRREARFRTVTRMEFARTRTAAYQAQVTAELEELDRANPVDAEHAATVSAADAARHASIQAGIDAMNTPEKIRERRRATIEHRLAHEAFWADHLIQLRLSVKRSYGTCDWCRTHFAVGL